ncbi:hypothetical protein AUEXF2481DRAFT_334297 [Aureobasidium subglaciale EXF-2481]|uniref:Uncharacterized protein n=1 Tax=Aureobasidium subglaciale (strain EXF-2481) TaxID=1043005 RepID=A0A074Y6F3_AURSE|nr:uncharacterized protein AUEXF2481DRAFT_334297 [Aureobasidium subglaciale EXF-2481]KAI5199845.1 hypothetical protein E4T38_06850 [Aureobasidium subglaciale]KAI5218735.1 hypothetical protein E4T40_06740 [Aureobasidium subglaciale]KAI5222379.1 hypothetical protein E4T41_06701 [Aureobasidium subglaciale]KAI5259880.1 hypothetical protein E4T46_06546 [Aureobasidium subglaciale]KEQ93280.1 hypothetical protein AUEXF2481DRAFT_334297 [Aureobasidium subglaciale EXF-2481]
MAAVQLNFTLRTSSNCKTVHLIGSWDGYKSQLPLSKDQTKQGGWKGTFRFQGSTLKPGSRYWYYYIIDGYHVSHDPARESTTEPTTGRKLNILDIPSAKSPAPRPAPAPSSKSQSSHTSKHTRRTSEHIPKGRSLSPSQIKCPRPNRPHETRTIAREQYNASSIDRLATRLKTTQLDSDSESDSGSDVPSLTSSRSSASSSPSSATSRSSSASCCTCNRFGITRSGNRVKLDCGGDVCNYDDGSDCSSESEDEKMHRARTTRRQGMIVRR